MDNRKIGLTVLILSTLFGTVAFTAMTKFANHAQDIGCFDNPQCTQLESVLNWSHFTVGIVFAAFALGIYLLFFSKSEHLLRQAIKRLEVEKNRLEKEHHVKISDGKFNAILKTLDPAESTILSIIKEQEGITQNTLRIKANLSKGKVSQVLSDFHKRGLIKKEEKGKTYALYVTNF